MRSDWRRTQGLRIEDDAYAEANRLVGAGCGNVVVNWIAGLSRQKEESLRWFDKMEVEAGRFHSPELARFLIAMARRHWLRTEEARRKSVEGALSWVKSETFTKAESRSLYRTLAVVNHPVKKEMAAALGSLPDVDPDIATALAEAGGGLPVFPELGAELIKDSPPDTDRIFASASERMIDDCTLNFRYIFYNCLPRWGGSVEMIERFGNACFDADRFDSMLPLAYLDAQFFLASEQDIPLERHFADKVRFSRCMKAADALVGNMNIHSRARHAATYYKAMLTYCGGDLSTLRTFFTEKYVRNMPPVYMIEQAEPYGAMVGALAALSGADAEKTVPLHEKFRSGRYDEFIAGAKALAGEVALTREAQDYLRMYSKIASLKSPGYDGSWIEAELVKSDAEFFTRFPQWHRDSRGQGWFVPPLRGNRVPIKWNMPLGDEFEVVVGLNPLMGVSHAQASIQYWVSHYDRQSLPEVLFELENGEIRVWLMESGENVENRWHTDSKTTPYRGGVISVRVQYKNGRISVWLGDGVAANLTSDRFAPTFAALKGRGGSSVICAKGLCVRSWKGRSTSSRK